MIPGPMDATQAVRPDLAPQLSVGESFFGGSRRPMHSSTAIAFRALVMLIVMISIPLFAIFGRDLPEIVKNLLTGRFVIHVSDAGHSAGAVPTAGPVPSSPAPLQPSAITSAGAANPFSEPASYRAAGSADVANVKPVALQAEATPAGLGEHASATIPADPFATKGPMAQPAGFQPPPTLHPIGSNDFAAQPNGLEATASRTQNTLQSAASTVGPNSGGLTATEGASGGREGWSTAATQSKVGGTSTDNEQFRRAGARLRELGATHYTLETWGPDNNQFRFVCKMAIGGNAEMNRYFQAIDNDPWRAMQSVLEQVEAWRAQQPHQ